MDREKLEIPVVGRGDDATVARRLLALLVTNPALGSCMAAPSRPRRRFRAVLLYLHGFPDLSVHPSRLDMASRMPYKLAEAWLTQGHGKDEGLAFLCFNFGGIPGSDASMSFADKTIAQELEDALAACQFVREQLLVAPNEEDKGSDNHVPSDHSPRGLHVVGLSTGAIVASLLRDRDIAESITAIAGLADLPQGIAYDFTSSQIEQFERTGACWKEFFIPDGAELPRHHAGISLDGVNEAPEDELVQLASCPPRKIYLRLRRRYWDEARDGSLDIRRSVGAPSPPLLVIHGDADQNVPVADGRALFEAAAQPARLVVLPRANHLLTNSKHLKKALQAILAHAHAASSVATT